ncbi:unnamed protein product [Alopecurus aequalis]
MLLALRSLLNRPEPLFSCLRPASRHVSHRTAVLGSHNTLIGSRGYASNNSNGDSATEVNRQHPASNRHLYVVLDDSKDGFGIHKLDIDDEDPDAGGAWRLPEPPLLRVAFPTVYNRAQFAAVGSSIVAVGSCRTVLEKDEGGFVFIYDTKTATQSHGHEYYYKFDDDDLYPSGLHCLTAHHGGEDDKFWNWEPLCPSSPFDKPLFPSSSWYWSDNTNLQMLPFYADDITAHAVHTMPGAAPHQHEIIVSARASRESEWTHRVPFEKTAGWMLHGEWHLPFVGHAHYDANLHNWLGLHLADGYSSSLDGYLCSGNVMSAPSEWNIGKEKLCCLDEDTAAGWIHVDAKLVPMASTDKAGTEYCLLERLEPKDGECLGESDKCLLRLTTFRVKSGKNGEPIATTSRPARSYKVSRYNRYFEAQVFWM